MPTSEDSRFVNKSSRAETGTDCGTASFSNMEPQAGGVGKILAMSFRTSRLRNIPV